MEMLRQLKHDIPPKMTLLLQEARKRADKRHAKRLANRQSACTSRARKKALVEEMTALNARLRRQALILSLLPDLVICLDPDGIRMTFTSAQVERVLHHATTDLVGAPLMDLIEPGSRDALSRFLTQSRLRAVSREEEPDDDDDEEDNHNNHSKVTTSSRHHNNRHHHPASMTKKKKSSRRDEPDKAYETAGGTAGPRTVTETSSSSMSFPLSVVLQPTTTTTTKTTTRSDDPDHSDATSSQDKQPSSLTGNSVAGHSGSDEPTTKPSSSSSLTNNPQKNDHNTNNNINDTGNNNTKTLSKEDTSISQSSDASNTSSSHTDSSNAKNLLSANANLERNVRQHNQKIMNQHQRAAAGYKDDVIGAAVTANNASARLSSLQHLRSAESSEEDSGYRESNDSREETSSSSDGETPSQRNGAARRPKLIAPSCQVCLIRKDLSTLWCEVTLSLRTKDSDDEPNDNEAEAQTTDDPHKVIRDDASMSADGAVVEKVKVPLVKEILLCLRPIRDGETKADETHRFQPCRSSTVMVSEDNRSSDAAMAGGEDGTAWSEGPPPTKKCRRTQTERSPLAKGGTREEIDTAVVESLMLMSNHKKV